MWVNPCLCWLIFFSIYLLFVIHPLSISKSYCEHGSLTNSERPLQTPPSIWYFPSLHPSPRGLPIYAEAMALAYTHGNSGNSTSFFTPKNHVDLWILRYFDLRAVSSPLCSSDWSNGDLLDHTKYLELPGIVTDIGPFNKNYVLKLSSFQCKPRS